MTPTARCWREPAALAALGPEWAALWQRSRASPFQHPAWLLPWWRHFGAGSPRLATLRDGAGRLAGVLPLYDLAEEDKTLPMGAGVSDYHDALLAPDAPPDAAPMLLAAALADAALPCHLSGLPPDAALRTAAAPPGWTARTETSETCPVMHPNDVPPRQRRKLRMARHRADRTGGCQAIGGGPDMFAHLVRLHTLSWETRGEAGVLADPRVQAFHAAALPGLAAAGLLRLRGLRLGNTVAAVIYALQAPGRLFFYLSGFDPRRAFESPGTILLGAMIEEAAATGVEELHFLRGGEPYKYAWGARDRHNALRILERA